MATTVYLQKSKFGSLVPIDDHDREEIRGLRESDVIKAVLTVPRKSAYHRWFFGFLHTVWTNLPPSMTAKLGNKDALRASLEMATGWHESETIWDPDTQKLAVRYRPKSMAFHKMSQDEFRKLANDVIDFVLKRLATDWNKEDLEEAVLNYLHMNDMP